MDIQEELNKMKQIIKDKNKYPIFLLVQDYQEGI